MKSWELREGGGTGTAMWHGRSGRNQGAVGVRNGMKGTKRDDLVQEYKGWWSYKARWSLTDGTRRKYAMRGVYKANQTKRILLSPNSGEKLLCCVKKLQAIKYKKTCQEKKWEQGSFAVKQQQSPDSLTTWRNNLRLVGTHQGESGNWGKLSHITVVDQ